MSDQKKPRNLRLAILLAVSDWDAREALMRQRGEAEADSAEAAVMTGLLRAIDRVDIARDQMNDALATAEKRIAETRQLIEQGQMLNDRGMLQCNPDQAIAAFEASMRAAVDTLLVAEKVLGRKIYDESI